MKTLSSNSTVPFSDSIQFRQQSVRMVGSIVNSRTSNNDLLKLKLRKLYMAYRYKWTVQGIARFIINHKDELTQLAIKYNKPTNDLNQLIQEAYEKI